MTKPWLSLTAETIHRMPGTVAVFEIADGDGTVLDIDYAGGRAVHGLRSKLTEALEHFGPGHRFRYEITTSYLSRYEEVAMVHHAAHRNLPARVIQRGAPRGRLSPS